jgi:hypothetical protein
MNFILDNVIERGAFEDVITPLAVDRMFITVSDLSTELEWDVQHGWYTVLLDINKWYHLVDQADLDS